jgi:cytochrome c peroxidase
LHGVETQAHAAMNVHRFSESGILADFPTLVQYNGQFFQAFNVTDFTRYNIAKAIAAFERTIITNRAPFQKWLRGDKNAITYTEKRGAALFFGKAGCVACHTGPALNSMTFYALGFNDIDGAWDPGSVDLTRFGGTVAPNVRKGRGGFTGNAVDDYKFKTPQLYNLRENTYLGHGSSFASVREVIAYKNKGVKENALVPGGQLATEFAPLGLSEREIDVLAAFVSDALYDPTLGPRFDAFHMPSNNCFPNQDPQSLIDQASFCEHQLLTFEPQHEPRPPSLLPGPRRISANGR